MSIHQTVYEVDHDVDSRGLHHWMIRRNKYRPEMKSRLGVSVFASMSEVSDYIERESKA